MTLWLVLPTNQPSSSQHTEESAIDKLKKRGELKDAGVIIEEEFQKIKTKLIAEF